MKHRRAKLTLDGGRELRIRMALVSNGLRMSEVARRAGVSNSMVYHVVAGRKRSEKVAKALSRMLGLPLAVTRVDVPAPRVRTHAGAKS